MPRKIKSGLIQMSLPKTEGEGTIEEIKEATISERGARIDDKRSEAAMEKRKNVGYF